ncbi:DNA mismatch repair endonuclease MutL, partial [Photobacterium sanctipauli]
EAIVSLGFRGEALASISSVSRLTLTSRTAEQEEAWSAYAEGRDMDVQLKPAAHPVGTTLEVLDLFFNTPARRKFLRTEKTEFGHIDELLKRIALSRMDVTINLRHNGKTIRQYRAASTQVQKERRLAAVCGSQFLNHALAVELAHGDLKLSGWICSPQGARSQNDIQYCYVNGRMMKDKLINHAIRQAYETSLPPDRYAAYALFIEVDPHQVDVNVHPAKHEVRFHQARLVHDFICQGLQSALIQGADEHEAVVAPAPRASAQATEYSAAPTPSYNVSEPDSALAAVARTPDYPNKAPAREWLSSGGQQAGARRESAAEPPRQSAPQYQPKPSTGPSTSRPHGGSNKGSAASRYGEDGPTEQEVAAYQQLMRTVDSEPKPAPTVAPNPISNPAPGHQSQYREPPRSVPPTTSCQPAPAATQPTATPVAQQQAPLAPTRQDAVDTTNGVGLGKALCLVQQKYLLLNRDEGVALLALDKAMALRVKGQLRLAQTEGLKPQPLLIPHSVPVDAGMIECAEQHALLLKQLGIQLKAKGKSHLIIMSVCQPLRQQNLQQLIPALVSYLAAIAEDPEQQGWDKLLEWLAQQLVIPADAYSLSQAIQLVTELEQLWGSELENYYPNLLRAVDVGAAIEAFDYD